MHGMQRYSTSSYPSEAEVAHVIVKHETIRTWEVADG